MRVPESVASAGAGSKGRPTDEGKENCRLRFASFGAYIFWSSSISSGSFNEVVKMGSMVDEGLK